MSQSELSIEDVPAKARSSLESLLEESFTGMYLWHAKRTLSNVEVVKKATLNGKDVGLAMLKMLEHDLGYVYYVAVAQAQRGKGVGGYLLDKSLEYFSNLGANEVLASVEEDNVESVRLFHSRGFEENGFWELAKRYGRIRTTKLWGKMLVVSGEIVLRKSISPKLTE